MCLAACINALYYHREVVSLFATTAQLLIEMAKWELPIGFVVTAAINREEKLSYAIRLRY